MSEGKPFQNESGVIYVGTMTMWNEVNFSRFSFDLVKRLSGEFKIGMVSSFHGMPFGVGK